MGSATPTPLAMVRNRPSNESVISTPFGTRRIPFADSTSLFEDHADREIVDADTRATRGGRPRRPAPCTIASVMAGGQMRDELADLLRGRLRRACPG